MPMCQEEPVPRAPPRLAPSHRSATMRSARRAVAACVRGLAIGALLPSIALAQTSPNGIATAPSDTWHLQTSMMNMDASTRFTASIVLNNPGESIVYVRSSAERVAIVDGERRRLPIPEGALRVYPEEFVLRPGEAFTARLVADPDRMAGVSASYYVKFVDSADIRADELGKGGVQSAYLLGFEALVTVNRTPVPRIGAAQLRLARDEGDDVYALTNLSGRHLYLDRGGLCPPSRPMLVDCQAFPEFPRQSLLPDETVRFPITPLRPAAEDLVAVMVHAGLSQRDRVEVVYLPARPASR